MNRERLNSLEMLSTEKKFPKNKTKEYVIFKLMNQAGLEKIICY